MPHPAKLEPTRILAAARTLLEVDGQSGLTMRALARELGVAAPSLYLYVESREDLLRQLTREGLLEFGRYLSSAIEGIADPSARIHQLADSYAEFASDNPQLFALLFGPGPDERLVDPAIAAEASAPLLETLADLAPADQVLNVGQGLWSLVHGFATLSLAEQFRLGGEPRAAMHHAIDLLISGLHLAGPERAR